MRWLGEGSRRPRDGELTRLVTRPWCDTDVTWSFGPGLHWYWPHISGPWCLMPDPPPGIDTCCHVETVTRASHDNVRGFLVLMIRLHFIFTECDNRERGGDTRAPCVWYMIGCDDGVIKTRQRMRRVHPTSPRQPTINIQMILDRGWWKIQTSTHTRSPALNCGVIPL